MPLNELSATRVGLGGFRLVLPGRVPTKKNRPRIIRVGGYPRVAPCKEYASWIHDTEAAALILSARLSCAGLTLPVEVPLTRTLRAYLFMKTTGDLSGYEQAVDDWLQHYGFIANDRQIRSHDGSRLMLDRQEPRLEIVAQPYEMRPGEI